MAKKFLQRQGNILSKLGKRRKKKQKWKKPTGRDNKMREKRKGYPVVVSIGYKKSKSEMKKIPIIRNINEIEETSGKEIIIGKIGRKKREEIIKKAEEKKIKIYNLPKKAKEKITESKNKEIEEGKK